MNLAGHCMIGTRIPRITTTTIAIKLRIMRPKPPYPSINPNIAALVFPDIPFLNSLIPICPSTIETHQAIGEIQIRHSIAHVLIDWTSPKDDRTIEEKTHPKHSESHPKIAQDRDRMDFELRGWELN